MISLLLLTIVIGPVFKMISRSNSTFTAFVDQSDFQLPPFDPHFDPVVHNKYFVRFVIFGYVKSVDSDLLLCFNFLGDPTHLIFSVDKTKCFVMSV